MQWLSLVAILAVAGIALYAFREIRRIHAGSLNALLDMHEKSLIQSGIHPAMLKTNFETKNPVSSYAEPELAEELAMEDRLAREPSWRPE
jgi:hypothetical protein